MSAGVVVKGMHRPKGVPEGEVGVILKPLGDMNFFIESEILAIDIVEEGRHLKSAVKRRVKNPLSRLGSALDLDEGEFFLPGVFGFLQDLFEILIITDLCVEVQSRVLNADMGEGQPNLDDSFFILTFESDIRSKRVSLGLLAPALISIP